MPGTIIDRGNFFFISQVLFTVSNPFFNLAEAKDDKEYKGYFKDPDDYLIVSNQLCTKDDFMAKVVKSMNDGGCGAEKRSMDISDIFGDTICKDVLSSYPYITRYGSANSTIEDCLCKLLESVDDNCDAETWKTIAIVAGCLAGCVVLAAASGALYYYEVPSKIANFFTSLKDYSLSLANQLKAQVVTPDSPASEAPNPVSETDSSFSCNPLIFFRRLVPTKSNENTELQETISPP